MNYVSYIEMIQALLGRLVILTFFEPTTVRNVFFSLENKHMLRVHGHCRITVHWHDVTVYWPTAYIFWPNVQVFLCSHILVMSIYLYIRVRIRIHIHICIFVWSLALFTMKSLSFPLPKKLLMEAWSIWKFVQCQTTSSTNRLYIIIGFLLIRIHNGWTFSWDIYIVYWCIYRDVLLFCRCFHFLFHHLPKVPFRLSPNQRDDHQWQNARFYSTLENLVIR